jgi:Sulfatase-modifying factor enzyme 1
VPGSLVFRKTSGPVNLDDYRNWSEHKPGAYWKRPGGPGTTINGRDRHPVVQVAYEDAEAYAALPESVAATVGLRTSGWAPRSILGLWVLVALVSGLAALAG